MPDDLSLEQIRAYGAGFDHYVNLRPIRLYSGVSTPLKTATTETLDLVVVRENTEGEYAAQGGIFKPGYPDAVALQTAVFTHKGCEWVYCKLVEKDALSGPPVVKQFVSGEGFAYLGRSYRLTLTPEGTGVRLDRGRIHLPASQVGQGVQAMRCWYTDVGTKWLSKRIRPLAARLGEESVTVEVRDLGFRWGSARPQPGPRRINIHWATLQLPQASSITC